MMKKDFFWFYYILIFSGIFLLDRLTKVFALLVLQDWTLDVFPGLSLEFTLNRGVSWGMFSSSSSLGFFLLTSFILIVIGLFCWYTVVEYKQGKYVALEMLVIAGALSNIYDRFVYGGVIDFIDCYIGTWHWPAFNVADMAIVFGIGGIVVRGILCKHQKN